MNADKLTTTLHYLGLIETLGFKLTERYKGSLYNYWCIKDNKFHFHYIIWQ